MLHWKIQTTEDFQFFPEKPRLDREHVERIYVDGLEKSTTAPTLTRFNNSASVTVSRSLLDRNAGVRDATCVIASTVTLSVVASRVGLAPVGTSVQAVVFKSGGLDRHAPWRAWPAKRSTWKAGHSHTTSAPSMPPTGS